MAQVQQKVPLTQQEVQVIQQWHRVYADNSDPTDLDRGILRFSRDFFPDLIDARYGISNIHFEILADFIDLFHPKYKMNEERFLQLEVFRGASKSTLSNVICTLYTVCMNGREIIFPDKTRHTLEEDLIVLASETSAFAYNWVFTCRSQLSANQKLKYIFGDMKPKGLRDDEGRWRIDTFSAIRHDLDSPYNGRDIIVIGRGVGQQIRGLNLSGKRPTLIIADDLYSYKSVITPEAREKTARWWDAECINSLHANNGKILLIGTVVHEDTIIVANETNRFWRTIKFPIMEEEAFNKVVDKCCKIDRDKKSCIIDAAMALAMEQAGFTTYWKERFPLINILTKLAIAIENKNRGNGESIFWQEYFHIVLAEADKVIRQDQMQTCALEIVTKDGINFIKRIVNGQDTYVNVNTILSIDTASSANLGAAHTALVECSMDYYANIYFTYANSGRWGIRDERDESGKLMRIGIVDLVFFVIKDKVAKVGVEVYNVGTEVVRQIRSLMKIKKRRFITFEFSQTQNKEERILSTLSPYYQTRSAYHNFGQEELKRQLEFLGKTKLRDLADAAESAVRHLRPPSSIIKYEDKVNRATGYTPAEFLKKILPNQQTVGLRDWETC